MWSNKSVRLLKPLNIGIDCHIESPRAKILSPQARHDKQLGRTGVAHAMVEPCYTIRFGANMAKSGQTARNIPKTWDKPRAQGPPSARSEGRIPLNPCLNKSQREACGFSWTIAETVSVPVCPHKSPPSATDVQILMRRSLHDRTRGQPRNALQCPPQWAFRTIFAVPKFRSTQETLS